MLIAPFVLGLFLTTIDVGLVALGNTLDHHRACTALADHFEPWRANPLWRDEVSQRPELIRACTDDKWSVPIIYCLLDSYSPLELDRCVNLQPHS